MVKELRTARHGERAERAALAAAKRWGAVERLSRVALKVGGPLARRSKRGKGLPPPAAWGAGGDPAPSEVAAVYVPSCTNRIFGPSSAESAKRHPEDEFSRTR